MTQVNYDKTISELEAQLNAARKAKEEAKAQLLANIKPWLSDLPSLLGQKEIMTLLASLQARLAGGHRKVRGNPVPEPLKAQLVDAIKESDMTLSQMERAFGVSVSYISKIKKDLGLARPHNPNPGGEMVAM